MKLKSQKLSKNEKAVLEVVKKSTGPIKLIQSYLMLRKMV